MAGPFAPIQQQGISEQRLAQTTLPVSAEEAGVGVAKAIGQGLQAGADLNLERVTKQKQEALNEQLGAVQKGLEVFRFGDEQEVNAFEKAAAGGDRNAARILEEFNAIRAARESNRLPGQAATIRARALLKEAISASPEFEEELRAAARKSLGVSPETEAFRSLLREPAAGKKTEAQKRQEAFNADVQDYMRDFGGDQDTAIAVIRQRNRLEFNAQLAENDIKIGSFNATKAQEFVNARGSALIADTIGLITQQTKANNGVFDIASAKLLVRSQVAQVRQQALRGISDPKMTGEISKNMQALETTLLKLVEEGSVENKQTRLFETGVAMTRAQTFYNYEDLRAFMALPNTDGILKAMEITAQFANNPTIGKALGITTPIEQFSAIGANTVLPTITRMRQGEPAADDNEVRVRSFFNREVIKDESTKEETKVSALMQIVQDAGEFTAITALDSGQAVAEVVKSGRMRAQVSSLFATKLESADATLRETAKRFPDGLVTVREGRLRIDSTNLPGQLDIKVLRDQIDDYNRLLDVHDKYVGAGVITKWNIAPFDATPTLTPEPDAAAEPVPTRLRWNPESRTLEEVQ